MKYLLDTNVLSEMARPQPNADVIAWLRQLPDEDAFMSAISIAEVRLGIALLPTGRRRIDLTAWLDDGLIARFGNRILAVDQAVAMLWGDIMATARRKGSGLKPMDGMIAATAMANHLTLATRNGKDFSTVDVALLNPWQA